MATEALRVGRVTPGSPPLGLRMAGRRFLGHASPRILLPLAVASVAARVVVGRWGLQDVFYVAVPLALQPFTEWVIHVTVLHFKPRRIANRLFDPMPSRRHRLHHADPWDEALVFIPIPVLVVLLAVVAAAFGLLAPWPRGLTGVCTALFILLAYEWVHFLVHSRYVPRSRLYRYVWRAHRLHHFKNEHYWFGVTLHAGDWAFRTFPARDAVPTSDTVRTLGVTEETLAAL